MTRIVTAAFLGVLSIALVVGEAQTAPKPSPVPVQWELDIDVRKPQPIKVLLPGEARPKLFWYMTYTVSNHTGAEQVFVPEFVLYTDNGQILRAGQGVPMAVFDAVRKGVNDPHLRDTVGVAGKLLQGDDNAKTGVAVWPDFDPQAGGFDVFIGGLSGETAEVKLPEPIEVEQRDIKGNVKKVTKDKLILSKTLDLKYGIPGEAADRIHVTPTLTGKDWVMR